MCGHHGSMLGFVISLVIIGVVAGFVARLLVPGHDRLGFLRTMALGIVGSFIGGFLGYLLFGKDVDEGAVQTAGFVGSIVGAVIALLLYRALFKPRLTLPGRRGLLRRRGILQR